MSSQAEALWYYYKKSSQNILQLKLYKMIVKLWKNIVQGVHFVKSRSLYNETLLKMKVLVSCFSKILLNASGT